MCSPYSGQLHFVRVRVRAIDSAGCTPLLRMIALMLNLEHMYISKSQISENVRDFDTFFQFARGIVTHIEDCCNGDPISKTSPADHLI